jgi:hypothetical protein
MKYLKLFENFNDSDIEAIANVILDDLKAKKSKRAAFNEDHFKKFMNQKGIKDIDTINRVKKYLKSMGVSVIQDHDDNNDKHYGIEADIANSIIGDLEKKKEEKGYFTYNDYESWMKERGTSDEIINQVATLLVSKGFDFDPEPEEDLPSDFEMKLYTKENRNSKRS